MNLVEKLSSKKFFVFNLVLIGVIFGFSLSFLSFSCSSQQAKNVARAETGTVSSVVSADDYASAVRMQNVFRAVAEKVVPSVVEVTTITTVKTTQSQTIPGWDFFFGPQEEDQSEYQSTGLGSGVIVRQDKDVYYVLTNEHVVEDAEQISVKTSDGQEFPGTLVGQDARRDLAVISFKTSEVFPVAVLGDSDEVRVGDWAIAIGNPLGDQFSFSVTMGIVSAVGRTGGPGNNINDFIQTDASINQGNSGGALVNIRGEVIGINTWIASNNGGGSVGLGFAIPINNAKRSIDDFISSGKISYGWLGVSLVEADKEMMKALKVDGKKGALASQIFMGSPAEKGGIRPGDFITHVDGKEARGVSQLTMMVGDLKAGQKAVFTVIRDGSEQKFTVTIEPRNDQVAAENKKLWPGLQVIPITDDVRSALDLEKNARGIAVITVMPESPAAVIGMQRGDRVTAVNDTPVTDAASFYKALREKTTKELWFSFDRSGTELDSLKYKR